MASVLAVCVVKSLHPDSGRWGVTAIDKGSVDGPVRVGDYGLYADVQVDRKHHGGLDKALYAYAQEDIDYWESELGREIEAEFTERAKDFTEAERINAFNAHMERTGSIAHDAEQFAHDMEGRCTTKNGQKGEGRRPRWLVADYEAGDVVFHDPYMIHGAVKNEDEKGRIRLSCDLRFYEKGAAADERWMNVHWTPNDGL